MQRSLVSSASSTDYFLLTLTKLARFERRERLKERSIPLKLQRSHLSILAFEVFAIVNSVRLPLRPAETRLAPSL